jgi:hypothetical protein
MHNIHPFSGEGKWYKGNLHSHSTNSDGVVSPEQAVMFYKAHGYDFMAVTDHHMFTDQSHLGDAEFLILPGVEMSIDQERMPKSEHLNGFQIKAINGNRLSGAYFEHEQAVPPASWTTPAGVQHGIDMLRSKGLAVTLNHPAWSRSDRETLLQAENYFAIEIYNHLSEYEERVGLATDYWDFLLRRGRKVWGIAVDDTHHYDGLSDNGGWVMVNAPELAHDAIMESLLAGRFYSSSGPEIYDYRIEAGEVAVECSPVKAIHFISYPSRGKSFRANGNDDLICARWKLQGDEIYVRVECEDRQGKYAWTNPIYYNSDFLKYLDENYLA